MPTPQNVFRTSAMIHTAESASVRLRIASAVRDVPAAFPLASTVGNHFNVPLNVPPGNAGVVWAPDTVPLVVAKGGDIGDLPSPTPRNLTEYVPWRPRHAPKHAEGDEAAPAQERKSPDHTLVALDHQVVAEDDASKKPGNAPTEVGREADASFARKVALHEVNRDDRREDGKLHLGRDDHLPPRVLYALLLRI
eukprot:UN3601